MQVAVVLSQYRHIYNRAAGEVIGYLLKASETDQSIPAQCTVHVCTFQRETQQSVVICRGDRCRLSLFKESLSNPTCRYMKQQRPSRLGSKLFRGRMQHRLDIAYDDYLYETSWSLQSLTTGTVACCHVRL